MEIEAEKTDAGVPKGHGCFRGVFVAQIACFFLFVGCLLGTRSFRDFHPEPGTTMDEVRAEWGPPLTADSLGDGGEVWHYGNWGDPSLGVRFDAEGRVVFWWSV